MNAEVLSKLDEMSLTKGNHEEYFFKELGLSHVGLIEYLEEGGFFTDPASSRYHGAWKGGLAQHSLRVLHHVLRLYEQFCPDTDLMSMLYGTVLHDLCKMGSYEISTRNVKKNNVWVQEPFYMNKNGVVTVGHGAESCRRIEKLRINLSEGWYQAVRWHMGNFDASETDRYALMAAQKAHPEVLLLQTADIMAGIREDI